MNESSEKDGKPIPEREAPEGPGKSIEHEMTWKDVSQLPVDQQRAIYRRLFETSCERRRQLRAEGSQARDPLPPPIDDSKPAPAVEMEALQRLVSDEEMPPGEVDRLFSFIDQHRIWYDTYHKLLDEEIRKEV
jgi:hypothetical protein